MLRNVTLLLICIVQVFCDTDCEPCTCRIESEKIVADCRGTDSNSLKYLKNIPTFSNLDVKVIRLGHQSIETLPNNVFVDANIGEIEQVDIYFCKLHTIEKGALKNLTKLKIFSSVLTNVSQLVVGTFDDNLRLEVLNFSHNSIKELNNGLFDKLLHLKTLQIDNNDLYRIGITLFNNNLKLTELKLSNNKLEYVDGNVLENLNPDLKLLIDNNPWNCNCSLWKFHNLSLKYLEEDTELPKCKNTTRRTLRSTSWKTLKDKDFPCNASINIHVIREPNTKNITLVCEAQANPAPKELRWYSIENGQSYYIHSTSRASNQTKFTLFTGISIKEQPTSELMYSCYVEPKKSDQMIQMKINKIITYAEIANKISKQINQNDMSTETVALHQTPEIKHVSFCVSTQLECSSDIPSSILWFFRGFNIDKDVIKRAGNKYEIKTETNKSVLVINNVLVEDQGLYECRNSLKNTKWYVTRPTAEESPLLAVVLGTIFLVLLLGFVIMLCYFMRRNNAKMKSSTLNRSVNRNSANEYVTNKNEFMEESSIYISSDNNIYEDIIYGPTGTK